MTYAFPLPIPVLETERLTLREPRESDFTAALAFNDSPRNVFVGGMLERRWIWRGVLANIGHWALRGYGFWAVEDRATGRFCGHVGLWYPEGWMEPEVGWVLMDHAEGRSIAHEAATEARRYAYDMLGWQTAVSMIDPANDRSIRLAQRMGCRFEGTYSHVRLGPMEIWRHPAPADLRTA